MAEAGLTGRKGGRGFCQYRAEGVPAPAAGDLGDAASPTPPETVALIENRAVKMAAGLADAITGAGISVVRHPAPEARLIIVAAKPERRVLDAALASGRPADIVAIHVTGPEKTKPRLAELVVTRLTAPSRAAPQPRSSPSSAWTR
jgi:3-hydroxybutyryl-CoA dehydrogenase